MWSKKLSIHAVFLCALYALLDKVRREGLLLIEMGLKEPEHASRIFVKTPQMFRVVLNVG